MKTTSSPIVRVACLTAAAAFMSLNFSLADDWWDLGPLPTTQAPPKSIPFDQLGAEAQKKYSEADSRIIPTKGGARLKAVMQDLEGEATSEGLWLTSTADGDLAKPNRFRVTATRVSRQPAAQDNHSAFDIAPAGHVRVSADAAIFMRPGIIEEYTVSADGVRQDFVLLQRALGSGETLAVDLEVSGARAEAAAYGVKLTVLATGRELAYSRLKVSDAMGRELKAHFDVRAPDHLRVAVDDTDAVYPVRIDPTFSDADWISMGGLAGANGNVYAMAHNGSGDLYIGGAFTIVGNVLANRVAKWSGSTWSALGTGMNNPVQDLIFSGGFLYAGGDFTTAGGVTVNRIARWDGSTWSAFGTGMNGAVYAIAVVGSDLYAGGAFTNAGGVAANRIAKWSSGGPWSALGTGMNNAVYALAHNGTYLVAGGVFTTAGGVTAGNIAKWNGTSWSDVSAGTNGAVHALAVSGVDVYAGGTFTLAGGGPTNRIAKWVGSGGFWTNVGAGLDNAVYTVAVSGSDVYVGGDFTTAGGGAANRLAKWNGSAWSALSAGTGPNNSVNVLAVNGSDVYVGGWFTAVDGVTAKYIANWNGSAWSSVGTGGLDFYVLALAVSGSDLYAGGYFTVAAGSSANYIAKWNGSAWSALGTGMNNYVSALAVSGSDLYAGGAFTTAGGGSANYIAKWNGSAWSGLGTGMNGSVSALAVSGSDLYAAGSFITAGGLTVNRVARWNGSTWSAMGTGLDLWANAIAATGTDVYVGGEFSTAGGVSASRIARWNGSAWSALGTGVNGRVYALLVSGADLYAGGDFSTAGGVTVNRIARWNGSAWSALGTGMNSPYAVRSLAMSGSDLFAGGDFTTAGGVSASQIAKWDGSTWSALGSGTNDDVYALVATGSTLYAGGLFITAGGKVSAYLAKANLSAPPPTLTLGSATSITTTGATLNGTVNPNGAATTAQFEYGQTISYGGVASVTLSPNDGSTAQAVNAPVTGLSPGTLYHFRLTATNAGGSSATSDGTFMTVGVPEIALHNGANTGAPQLTDGQVAVVDFGYTARGTTLARDFTIANTGTANLTVSSITAPTGYTVLNAPGAAIAALATHTFQVRLDAASTGTFSGSVTVNSDDADEAAFDFPITGVVQNAPFHNWAAGNGLSGADLAPTANPANDGVSNLLKYAFNMDPTMPDVTELTPGTGTSGLPTYDTTGSGASSFFRFEFIRRIGSGLIYTPKKSPDLLNWSNLTSTPTVTGIDANWERVVHLEPFDGTVIVELFGRVEVTLP